MKTIRKFSIINKEFLLNFPRFSRINLIKKGKKETLDIF